MKIEEKVNAALSGITMPQGRKDAVWERIAADIQKETETVKMRQKSRRWVIAAAAAVLAAIAVVVVMATANAPVKDTELAVATPVPDDAADVQTADVQTADEQPVQEGLDTREGEAPAGEYGKTTFLSNLVVDGLTLEVPDTLPVYEDVPISVSQNEMAAIEDSAAAHGWQNIDMDSTEHDGLYFIWSRDVKGDILQITEQEHHEMRVQFLQDSGLADLLEAKGMTLNLDESDVNGAVWSVIEGNRGSGFVRLGFEEGKIVGDCKIWAVVSRIAAQTDTVPLSGAAKKAFFVVPEGVSPDPDAEYIPDKAVLIYTSGIPYYKFTILRPGIRSFYTAYALAVDESVIVQNETLKAAYERFVEYGF